ncbi:MAG: hypothetical protein KatS3mg024_1525 [Armatimonadota bacterium]|nr:MAG: hypothetical protein KatS3mg024_1525 [Armatimonadota bacterium]
MGFRKMLGRFLLVAIAAAILSGPLAVSCGPLFDDYLNYARLGEKAAPPAGDVMLTTASPLGQTFAVSPGTGEIYRIGLYVNNSGETWATDETVTLTLYDSPGKSRKLGAFSIDGATCRVQGLRHHEQDRVLLFPLRAKLDGQSSLYFELTVTGGDGQVRFHTVPAERYAGGRARLADKEQAFSLAFETHIKPVPDREANLRAFFDRFDLTLPQLAEVKKAVDAGDWEEAIAAMVRHFRGRTDLFDASIMDPKPDPSYDRAAADRFMAQKLWCGEGDSLKVLPWRIQSYWNPEYAECGQKFEPWLYGWQIERTLWGAYSATGDEKYARAGMDFRIQWVLDNCPSPKVTGIEASHQVWNELAANSRAPGHLAYVFSRVFRYPGFSNDEQLIYFMHWYDNAEYLLGTDVGGNWLAQAATGLYEFGRKFPEFKRSPEFASWGAEKLIEVSLETVRPDGTQHEAAIKYHAMVARRLKALMDDYSRGETKLDETVVPRLKRNLAGMYEWMAHTLQPDGFVVMCGDSWHEDYREELADVGRKIGRPDFVWIATKGKEGKPPAETSKSFPDGGYFIMRSDFGGDGRPFEDARQLYVHNGGWVGSHGHWDLLSVALYAYGRPLLIDPGGMWQAPEGHPDNYWQSRVHGMLVADGLDVTRDPGPTWWMAGEGADYLDGVHFGYARRGIPEVRRRIIFMRPDYFLVDDCAAADRDVQWDQNWNILAPDVRTDAAAGLIETTYGDGRGNLIIRRADTEPAAIEKRRGYVPLSEEELTETTIASFRRTGREARFTTVLYPYQGNRPRLDVQMVPVDGVANSKVRAVRVASGSQTDFVVFGDAALGEVSFRGGQHRLDGDMLAVRTREGRRILSYSAFRSRRAVFSGRELMRCANPQLNLDVAFRQDGTVAITAREKDPSLVVWVGDARRILVNGEPAVGRPSGGYLRVFPGEPEAVVVDDSSPGFQRMTEGTKWTPLVHPIGYGYTYTYHVIRPEWRPEGRYTAVVPKAGEYLIQAYVPDIAIGRPKAVEYGVHASPVRPASPGGAVLKVRQGDPGEGKTRIYTVDQSRLGNEWLDLGVWRVEKGRLPVLSIRNVSDENGPFLVFDAVRLIPVR